MVMKGFFTFKRVKLIFLTTIVTASMLGCGHKNNATVTSHTGSALQKNEEVVEEETVETAEASELYIVEDLNMVEETISLYSLSAGKQLRYKYNMTTKFLDKYGKNSTWAEFTVGSVVTIGDLLPSSGALSQVQKSNDVWVLEDLVKYDIQPENNLMAINGSNYKITDKTKAYSDTEKILLQSIGKDDVIKVIGIDKEIISIAVTTGHGYIHLSNTSLFDNSMIFIGNKIVSMINGEETIEVPEGTYKITVANDGWGGSAEYTVSRNEITEINLEDLKGDGPSYCLLTFLVTVPNTYVYIDGDEVDTTEPHYVKYGNHKLKVICEGYVSWNKTLVVNSEEATITLAMESNSEASNNNGQTTQNSATDNSENTDENEPEEETAGSSIKDDYDYEVDYLTTISDLIGSLMD